MPRPKLNSTARAQLEAQGLPSAFLDTLPSSSIQHYNRIYPLQRGSFDTPLAKPREQAPPTIPERLPFTGTAAAESAFLASEFGISPERGARAQEALEDFTAVQRTAGGTPARILSRLQQPFGETQFAQEVVGTARGEIPAKGFTGLLGALAPQTIQTAQQMDESYRQQLNANQAALMQMRVLYPNATDEQRIASQAYQRLSRDILTGKRDPRSLAALEAPELTPSAIGGPYVQREAARLAKELLTPRESPLGGIIESPALYAGRILSAPASAAVGAGEAILTSKTGGEAIPERIQAGESVTGAGRDIGAAAAEVTGIEALEPIGTGVGFVSEFFVNPIPGSGVARAVTRTGTAATRAAIAGGVRAGADVAASRVIGRVSPTYALRRTEVNPQIEQAIEQASRVARAYRNVPQPELTQRLTQRLTAAGVQDADTAAAELIEQIQTAGGSLSSDQAKAIARQIAQRITRPGAETIRITPTTAAPEDIATTIIQDYTGTRAGRLASTIRADPQRYISEHRGRPVIDVRRAAADAGLSEDELTDILTVAARRRYDLTESEITPPLKEPARLATMFSGMGTVEAGLTPGVARSVDAVEYMPNIMEQFNRIHGTAYVPRSVIDIDVADVAAAQPEVFHASPVCKNFTPAKRGIDNANELDRLSAEKVAEVIREVRPPVVTVENVPRYEGTAMFKLITDQLTASGYNWQADIVEAAEYGGAQERRRLILRALRDDLGKLPPAPEKTGGADWYATIEDLIADAPDYKPGRSRKPAPEPTPPPVFRKSDYELTDVTAKEAGEFLERNHYAGGAGRQGKYIIGLRDKAGELKGVAWWNPPGGGANVKRWAARQFVDAQGNPIHPDEVINLSRLAISPDVPRNAASYLLQRSIKRIRANSQQRRKAGQRPYRVALTYADQREGHTGFIYKLTGWTYTGESAKHSKWIDPATGRQVSTQATKNRNNAQMYAAGYKKQPGMRKHRYVLPIDRGLKYTGKETPPPAETPRAAPAAPAAPTAPPVPPILRNAPDEERRRFMAMAKRGTIDLTKPILSTGGSTSSTNILARNAGQPAPTIKSTPKELPKIYLPDGTAKRVTPRMMARLMGLSDSVPVPDTGSIATQTRAAKTMLGNGIEGNVTRRWFEPLYTVLSVTKDTGRIGRNLVEASVKRDLKEGMSLPRYNAAAAASLEEYALRHGAEDLTAIQAADPTTGRRLRRALTPRELRPGVVRQYAADLFADDDAMTPGLESLIDNTGRDLGTMGDDLLRATRTRERAQGLSRPEAFIAEVVSQGYAGDTRRATREAMHGLYGAFDSVGEALYSSAGIRNMRPNPALTRTEINKIMRSLADYDGTDPQLIELRDTLKAMNASAEGYGLGALKLPRLLADTTPANLAERLNIAGITSNQPPLFTPAAGLDLIGLTYMQARTGRILTEALTPQKLRAAGINYDPTAPAIQLSDTAAAMGGSNADAATLYDAVLAEMAGTAAVRFDVLNADQAGRLRSQLQASPRGRELLERYSDAELTELLLSVAHRLTGYQTATRPRFDEFKRFIESTLADRIQPIAQLQAAGVEDATRRIRQILNLDGVEEMLKRVSKPEEQRLLRLTGELIDIYDLITARNTAGLIDKANLNTAKDVIQAASGAAFFGPLSLLDSNSAISRWVKGGLLAGRFLPNLVYMGMNVLTAPAIVLSTLGPGAAARTAARMAAAPATSAIAGAAGLEAANRLTRLSPTIASLNAFYGYGDPLRVILTTPAGEVYRAADIAELIPRITTQAQAELAESLASDFRTYSGIAERAVMRGQPAERLTELQQSRGRRAFRAYTGLDPATGEVGQNVFNEMADAQDLTFRVGILIDALEAGRPVDEAMTLAQEALFDYGRMTDIERNYIAKAIWFWTFRRENLRAAALNLVENPERMRAAYQATGILSGYDDNPGPVAADYMQVRPFIKLFEDTELQRRYATYGPSAPMMDGLAEMIDYATAGAMLIDGTLYALTGDELIPGQLRTGTTAAARATEAATTAITGAAGFAVEERINPFISGALELGMGIQGNEKGQALTDYLDPRFLAYMDLNPDAAEIFKLSVDIEPIPYANEIPGNGHYQGRQWRLKADPANLATWSLIRHAMILGGFERTVRDYAPIYHRLTKEAGTEAAAMQLEPRISESLPPGLDLFFRSLGVASPVNVLTREERRRRNISDMSREIRAAGRTQQATPAPSVKE